MARKGIKRKGFSGGWHSTSKTNLKRSAEMLKQDGKIQAYRIVKTKYGFEMFQKAKKRRL